MSNPVYGLVLAFFVLVSSGCVADSIDEDGALGQTLDRFGDFSEENGSTSYEFSIDSLTGNELMAPMQDAVDDYKQNVSESTGMEVESSTVEITEISSNRAEIKVTYIGQTQDSEEKEIDVTFNFVKENGQWTLKDTLKDNFDTSQLSQDPRN